MALPPRLVILLPMVLSIVGFVLSALSLFAGHDKGFMEDYAIARLNVSGLGQDLISKDNNDSKQDDDDDGGILDTLKDKLDDVKDSAIDKINDLVGDAVGDVAEALGISDWYSIHVMNTCEGYYKPNGSVPEPSLNITNCTTSSPGNRFNLTKMLDKEVSAGPFDINLSDIGWPDKIQDTLDKINDALLGLFILYVLGMGFSGLAFLSSIAGLIKPDHKLVSIASLILSLLAALSLLIGSILITSAVTKGIDEINDLGEKIGVEAQKGTNFLIVSWVAAAVMLTATVFWGVKWCVTRRQNKRRWTEKRPH